MEYKIFECRECGFCYAEGPFNNQLLENIYNNHFYLTSQQNSYYSSSPIILNAKKRSLKLKQLIQNGTLLDIGTGKGYFVEEASNFLNAEGVDLSKFAVNEAQSEGRDVYYGDFMSYNFDKRFNIVTLWDAFACFPEPVSVIKRIHDILDDEGLLVLTLPMIDSILSKIFGRRWPLMIPPTNMVFFTPRSARLLLERNGFNILKTSYDAKWVSVDFIIRKLLRSLGLHNLANKNLPIPKKIRIPLKSRDILTLVAVKP